MKKDSSLKKKKNSENEPERELGSEKTIHGIGQGGGASIIAWVSDREDLLGRGMLGPHLVQRRVDGSTVK